MKKGFTLIEILVVLALLAIIAIIAVPNVVSFFSENKTKLSEIQKNQLETAVNSYISDYCINPISNNVTCGFSTRIDNTTGVIGVTTSSMSLNDFADTGYLDSQAIKNNCDGTIKINSSGNIDLSDITCNFN